MPAGAVWEITPPGAAKADFHATGQGHIVLRAEIVGADGQVVHET